MTKVNGKGFTLIEVIIVTSLVGVLAVVSGRLIVSVIKGYNKSQSVSQINRVGQYLLDVFSNEVRGAKSVSVISPTELLIVKADDSQATLLYVPKDCTGDSSNNFLSLGGLAITPINPRTGVDVESFTIVSNSAGVVSFNTTLAQACGLPDRPDYTGSASFTISVKPRSIYGN